VEEEGVEVKNPRKKSGRKVGRQAQIMAVPMWIALHNSVLEYEGTRLPGL